MRKGGVDFVLTAHEGSAGFAADVDGRMTGRPGLCIATLGPGATNLATGVGNAWLDRSPMIAITCNLVTAQLGRRIQMWIDHHALFQPITKATLRLEHGKIGETLTKAITLSMTEPIGPVHVDLPEDVALAITQEQIPEFSLPLQKCPATEDVLRRAQDILVSARRPIAVLGSSAMRMEDKDLLRQFIDRHQIPFATTAMAKGLIDEDHPLSLGCIERSCRQIQRRMLRSADLILGIGYDTIEVEFEAWIGETPLLQIDIEPVDIPSSVQLLHQVTDDLSSIFKRLCILPPIKHSWDAYEVSAHRHLFQTALRPKSSSFTAHAAIDAVRHVLPKDGILAFDVGAHTHQISAQWQTYSPKTFHLTNGWSSMGFGLPAAIAAKLARPDLPVVCILGDGCFQMTCGEVATAKRQGISLPIIVLDDKWLALIKVKQVRRQFPFYGTELQSEEYIEPPAHYFGVPCFGVRNAAALIEKIEAALKAPGPTIIEAFVDSDHYLETVYD
mgnify:FL=1